MPSPAIEAVWGPLRFPLLSDLEGLAMKRHVFTPEARPLAAFIGTVVLAVLAAVLVLIPDTAVQSVDSMSHLPTGWDDLLTTRF